MLHARRTGVWRGSYEITADDRPVTTWTPRAVRSGGTFDLDGQHFDVHGGLWGGRFELVTKDGEPVAAAERVGRKRWSVQADDRRFDFVRASVWSGEQALLDVAGRQVGSIRRASRWRSDAAADLPGMPLPVQVFALVAVLTTWEAQAASSSG